MCFVFAYFAYIKYLRGFGPQVLATSAKNLLLLILRILIVLLLALAAAKPIWTRGQGTPRSLAIELDNTLSTTAIVGGAPVLDRLTVTRRTPRPATRIPPRTHRSTSS